MKYLITGGAGFLGRHILARLLERGAAVRIFSRGNYPDLIKQGVEVVSGNLCDAEALSKACEGIDGVFHVASKVGIWGKAEDFYAVNVQGTINLIEACQKNKIKRLVYTSTPSVVYGTEDIINGNESLPYPGSYLAAYPETKAQAEKIILEANGKNLLTCSLRPHLIWGPGDTNLIPRLIERASTGKLRQVGAGTNQVSISYVENTADAHICAMDKLTPDSPVPGKAYFINEEEPVNCWDFLNKLLASLDCPGIQKKISLKKAYRIGSLLEFFYKLLRKTTEPPMTRFLAKQLASTHYFDISAAKKDLEWSPKISVEDGIERLRASKLKIKN